MSYKTQEMHMRRLADLVTQDLTHIYGEKESGPNGAKKVYLHIGKIFLRAMAKDLGFVESKVYDMRGGIGVAGEIAMMGMWNAGNGIYVLIRENDSLGCILYRGISHMKDYRGDRNRFLTRGYLLSGYENLLQRFMELRKEDPAYARKAS